MLPLRWKILCNAGNFGIVNGGHNVRTSRRQAQEAATPTPAVPPSAITAPTVYSETLDCKV
uniref:Uncharacterized protein n=1 Tax=Hyaloperonospora arabidopsidis (strain Emoy2) TaxID=559515 RepID=M4C6F5_HYAAE